MEANKRGRPLACRAALWAALALAMPAGAQQSSDADGGDQQAAANQRAAAVVEEVVVTGSRRDPRSAFDSPAPVDVIGSDDLSAQGGSDLTNLVRNVVPSYNVSTHPISDAATVIRPANLRGLAADHTLVLVNNKRRHRAAVISWLGNGVSDGAQGPDISVIPSIALKQLEILRDGASAQYGSDAIAGILNFILRDDASGYRTEAKAGIYTAESDGLTWSLSGNAGLPLGANGFLNLSAEFGAAGDTDRSVQRADADALIAAGNNDVKNPAQIWGSPKFKGDIKTFYNLGYEFGGVELYSYGNYAQRETDGSFYFRNPNTRSGVFATTDDKGTEDDEDDDERIRLIADETDDNTGDCPRLVIPDLEDADAVAADEAALEALAANDLCYAFNEDYPGGFTPRFGANTTDYSFLLGVRGELASGLRWDLSAHLGYNDADFFLNNSVNASLGPESPTDFDPGAYTQSEANLNFDVSYPLALQFMHSDLTLAAGFEWRQESFEITRGQEESYEIGPYAEAGFSSASNGFPGFSDLAAGSWDRSNVATYVDLQADVIEGLNLGAAIRFEDFDDFGTTLNGKLSLHYRLSDHLAFRATYSTGFRAPTPGQSNAYNVTTEFELPAGLVNKGTIPPTSAVARVKGGRPLNPEESVNRSFGLVFDRGDFSLTVDAFQIKLRDRLAPSQDFELSDAEIETLVDEGIESAENLKSFRFFTNDFDTTTKGFDVVGTYVLDWRLGRSDFSIAFNRTLTSVTDYTPEIVEESRVLELETGLPRSRLTVGALHVRGPINLQLRFNYFDDWYDSEDDQEYSGYGVFDLEVAYAFPLGLDLRVGIDNLFDALPAENPGAAAGVGNKYSQFAPGGYNGRFVYTRAAFDF